MNKLIPKHDYFKHTTRVRLSECEKQETIDAVERAGQYLNRMMTINRSEFSSSGNGQKVWRNLGSTMVYFSRWVNLVKGSTQPRRLYRRSRRYAIEQEAQQIANETGAEYSDVQGLLMMRMNKFVSDEY